MASDLTGCVVKVFKAPRFARPDDVVAGTGFLVNREYLVTCAHVIEIATGGTVTELEESEALGRSVKVELLTAKEKDGLLMRQSERQATVIRWYRTERDDIAVLQLKEPAKFTVPRDLWCRDHCGHGTFYGFAKPELWIRCDILRPTRNWVQINCDRDVVQGYSGAPVFDEHSMRLLGMVVAKSADGKVAKMIPASHLRGKLLGLEDADDLDDAVKIAMVEPLTHLLDRQDHIRQMRALSKGRCHCVVVDCRDQDAPEYLASKLKIEEYLERTRVLAYSERHVFGHLSVFANPDSDLLSVLAGELPILEEHCEPGGADVERWLVSEQGKKVVFIDHADDIATTDKIAWVLDGFKEIERRRLMIKEPFIVIIPWIRPEAPEQPVPVDAQLVPTLPVTKLPMLHQIEDKHLTGFVRQLPAVIREDFKAKFRHLNENKLRDCLDGAISACYRDVKDPLQEALIRALDTKQLAGWRLSQ